MKRILIAMALVSMAVPATAQEAKLPYDTGSVEEFLKKNKAAKKPAQSNCERRVAFSRSGVDRAPRWRQSNRVPTLSLGPFPRPKLHPKRVQRDGSRWVQAAMALVWRAGPAAAATRLVLSPRKQTSISNCSRSRPTRPRKSCIESGQHMTQLLSKLLATLLA